MQINKEVGLLYTDKQRDRVCGIQLGTVFRPYTSKGKALMNRFQHYKYLVWFPKKGFSIYL